MTREEAIKLIDDRMCFGRGKWSKHHMPERDAYWEAGEMAIEALEQPEQRWIPCEKELPEKYGEYRITWTTSASKKPFIGDAEYELSWEWDKDNYRYKGEWLLEDYVKAFPDVRVIAWMPLPEPYGGEQE